MVLLVLLLLVAAAPSVHAQEYEPVPGGELLDRLRSPLFLAGTENTASTESVSGDVINPAASGLKQRVHLDASYAAIVGDGAWSGHATNAGISYPTRVGVFSGSLNFASADYAALDIGQRGSLNVSFAKDLYPQLLFGAGLRGHFGSNGGSSAFGGGLDLGIIHIPGALGPFPEVRWGFALTQLGVGLKPIDGTTGSPSPFTPSADVQLTVVDSETVDWQVHTGFSAPSFQNLRYRVGSGLTFFDRVSLNLGWDVDLLEQTDSAREAGSLLPSVGLTVRLQTNISGEEGVISDRGWNRSDIAVHGGWAPLYDDVWAAGAGFNVALGVIDNTPPVVSKEYPETFYISPNNDGAADEFLLPVSIEDERFVTSWTMEIADAEGTVVRRIENKEQRPENEGFANVIDRLLYVKKGVEVPEVVRWDGRTDDGGIAPDGEYSFVLRAEDDNGNVRISEPNTLVVDATPPTVTIAEPEDSDALIFSPNDDGNKDALEITQESSPEDEWTLQILDASDAVVYEDTRTGESLASFTWDGRDSTGALVPDGVYSYQVYAQDRALNEGSGRLNNIIVDTEPTPIGLAVDIGHFSPNGDGRRDTVSLTPDIPVTDGIRSHTFRVRNAAGQTRRTVTGGTTVPSPWVFEGRGDDGTRLAEGAYTIELELTYRNGNQPRTTSPTVTLDVTPPRLAVTSDTTVFSPNGDGRLDTVSFIHETEEVPSWTATIAGEDGTAVRAYAWQGLPEAELRWDGRSAAGERAPDGTYRYVLTGEDRAGNIRSSSPIAVELDTRETPVFVSTSRPAFSPNGDGSADTLALLPQLADQSGVQRFDLELLDADGRTVARITDSGAPATSYVWDGRGPAGTVVPDGRYSVRLTADYRHGNRPVAVSAPFTIDTVPPSATIRAADAIFSPDGDGDKDEIVFDQTSSNERLWLAEIVPDGASEAIRTWELSGSLIPVTWDGTDDDGEIVPDGRYRYRVTSTDEGGNSFSTTTDRITIDTREVDAQVRLAAAAFSPNGDGVQDTVEVIPTINIDTPVSSWTVTLENSTTGVVVWESSGSGDLAPVVWDGRGTRGRAPDGIYRGRLRVAFARGDEVVVASARTVALDTVPPAATLTFSTPIISPNGDGNLDELIISHETSEETRWTARVLNEQGREVGRWEWAGRAPEQVAFAGLDTSRRRVADGAYRYELSSTDAAGNSTTVGPREFEIYTAETPLEVYASVAAFSPNGDGVIDRVEFPVIAGDAVGLEEFAFTVVSADGEVVFRQSGSSMPERLAWNGTGGNNRPAPEGRYTAELTARYRHGNRPVARTEPFVLDVTAPALEVGLNHAIFSPDGDGRRDEVAVTQTSESADQWTGRITAADGSEVRTFNWNGTVESFRWDGRDSAGNAVADGVYRYEVFGADAAGNTAEARLSAIRVDTRPTRLFATVDRRTISPNGDGVDDQLSIRAIARRQDGGEYREIAILDANDRVVRTFRSEQVRPEETIRWDGRNDAGAVADGTYTVRYRVAYDNGALGETITPAITVDTRGPELAATLEGLPFSPDNDGLNDELTIALSVRDQSAIASWSFEILDRNRRPFQRFEGTGRPGDRLTWDGRSSTGELVISAEDYPYRFTAIDATGNASTVEGVIPIDILVVRDGDLLKVQISNINFAPNSPQLELDAATETGARNIAVLDRLVEVFDKYGSYQIRVEGHAVNITQTEREEREELLPLSTARAEAVRQALIDRGMEPDRISIVGRGGSRPIVPHTDLENRWKNRRVEFILIR
jgi:flagellar hook assembly protein FlgD/outer membrane protein OmpA-like peptidoglycan-associated protein